MIDRRTLIASFGALGAWPAAAQQRPAQPRPRAQATLDQALTESGLPPDRLGLFVVDLAANAVVASSLADRAIIPASTMKLPAMVAALHVLGAEWRPVTTVWRSGPPSASVLTLVGGGDPLLAGEHLADLVRLIAQAGFTQAARFQFDPGTIPELSAIDQTQPLAATYNPAVSGLSSNFNRIHLRWRREDGAVRGDFTAVATRQRVPMEGFSLVAGAAGQSEPFRWRATETGEQWSLGPRQPDRGEIFLPIRRPSIATARLVRRLAADAGVTLPPPQPGRPPVDAREVARVEGQALITIVPQVLRWSNNLAAELCGLAAAPGASDIAAAAARHQQWIQQAAPGIDWSGFRLATHSGLGSASRATPRQLAATALLAQAEGWAALLPPYRPRDGGAPVEGVFAKSGTMAFAKSQAGLLTMADGRVCAFGLVLTDPERRAAYDRALDTFDRGMPSDARAWLERAQIAEAKIIEALVAGRIG